MHDHEVRNWASGPPPGKRSESGAGMADPSECTLASSLPPWGGARDGDDHPPSPNHEPEGHSGDAPQIILR
eukprot:5092729-Pyramimonas_sp.AAC.1